MTCSFDGGEKTKSARRSKVYVLPSGETVGIARQGRALDRGDARAALGLETLGAGARAPGLANGVKRTALFRVLPGVSAALQSRFDLISSELPRAEWTDAVSQMFGRIKATLERRGTRIEDFDAAIAAHALALDATLVTANVDHMIRVTGLRVEDWS